MPAVVAALQRVAPPGTVVRADSAVDETGIDSLGFLEALVDVEARTGVAVDEEVIRGLSIDLPDGTRMTVAHFTAALLSELTPEPAEGGP